MTPYERNASLTPENRVLPMEINENEVYTASEMREILKISQSTAMRMLKSGLIRAAKVGKQYRIMGKELLRIVSPKLEDKVGKLYNQGRRWIHEEMEEAPSEGMTSRVKIKDEPHRPV